MSASYMEMLFIDSDGHLRQTNLGAAMESNEATWRAFRKAKAFEVPAGESCFLLDYYNRHGDLADTISLDATGFTRITGAPALPEEEYRAFDKAFWQAQSLAVAKGESA